MQTNIHRLNVDSMLSTAKLLDSMGVSEMRIICTTVKTLAEHNEKCANCKWFRYCCGGCSAVGLALTEDVFGSDKSKCLFFEGEYMEKLEKALPGYKNVCSVSK